MEEKKLWQKISGSITYYLKDYDREKNNEELLADYLDNALPDDIEDDGVRRYLDKQTFKYVEVSDALVEKAISAFIERLIFCACIIGYVVPVTKEKKKRVCY